ncbi:MAG: MFS transporter [Dehalococcoidia bacterium]
MRSLVSISRPPLPPALRYPAFRTFWLGTIASITGYQILIITQGWLIYYLTDSTLFLGYTGLASSIPTIFLSLFGGVIADRVDRRLLLAGAETVSAGLVFLLGTLTLLDVVQEWHVLFIAFVSGLVWAFAGPAHEALYPQLVEPKVISSAVALDASVWSGTRIFAPMVAGLIIEHVGSTERVGMAVAFYVAGAGLLTMAAVVSSLKVAPVKGKPNGSPAREMLEGIKFIRNNSIFSFLIAMSFFNSFFGMSYVMLMPVFARDILQIGPDGQGVLFMFSGIGALATSLWMSTIGNTPHRGLLLIGGAIMAGFSIATFALTSDYVGSYFLAMAIMVVMGVFNTMYLNSIMSSLQILVPDDMRGRVMGTYAMTWSLMPLGGMQAGAIANFIGAPVAVAIGGLAVSAFAIGPAMINSRIRNLGGLVRQTELASATP